jgi:diguanylate cyclase (GGDEF)-like protein/PAS domain S-box-containing protein
MSKRAKEPGRRFADLSIRAKLVLIVAVATTVALVLANGVHLVYSRHTAAAAMAREVGILAQVLANRSTAALAFFDDVLARENLAALGAGKSIVSACIYAMDGSVFASYARPGSRSPDCPPLPLARGARFTAAALEYFQDIVLEGQPVGVLFIRSSLSPLQATTWNYLLVTIAAFAGALTVALLLASRLQLFVSEPIERLAATAGRISRTGDYALRAEQAGNDETGRLVEAFNRMLDTVHDRDRMLSESESRYRALVEGIPAVSYTAALDGLATTFISPQVEDIFGVAPREWVADPQLFSSLLHEADRQRVLDALRESRESGSMFAAEYRVRARHGRTLWIRDEARIVYDAHGRPLMRQGLMHDITERKRTEAALRQAAAVFSSTTEGVVITNANAEIVDVNRAFTEITGYAREEVLGRNPRFLQSRRHPPSFYRGMWTVIRKTGAWRGEIWNRRKDGEVYPGWLTISTVRDDKGNIVNYVGVVSDISAIKRSQEELDFLAHHDPLTGLPNRLLFNARLTHALEQARRENRMLAVMFLDLDQFKAINDSMGHAVGDQLLQEVAHRLRDRIRAEDTIARVGGDEFLLVIEELGVARDAGKVAHKLLECLANPFPLQEQELYVTTSIGISLYPRDGYDVENLIKNADAAMYRAKEQGRNNYQFYTQELTSSAYQRVLLETNLRRALEREQFSLRYQPQFCLRSRRLVGVEALLRWEREDEGTVLPGQFIPLAEESGLIVPIGEWVLRRVCEQMRAWQDAGVGIPRVAVNVSGKQINVPGFPDTVERILAQAGADPSLIELEVTENFIMRRAAHAIGVLERIKSFGVSIAIDDFGTGYSSLAYLKRLPIDMLKIDRTFVRDIPLDPNDEAIARAVIALGHSLQMNVLAEGVETQAQVDFLRREGCDQVQGFLYGQPVTAEEIVGCATPPADP